MKIHACLFILIILAAACGKPENKNLSPDSLSVQSDTTGITDSLGVTDAATSTDGTPVIDDLLTETISDTSVQDISGSLVLLVMPTEEQIDELSKQYDEETLSTILDDASFYQSTAGDLVDSLGIKVIASEKRFIRYRGVIREWNLDLYKTNSPWLVIFFDPEQRPEVVTTMNVKAEKIKSYFKRN